MAQLLVSPPDRRPIGSTAVWDLAYYVALEDARASGLLGLADSGGSCARILEGRLEWSGPQGPDLAGRICTLAQTWLERGRPAAAEYLSSFTPSDHQSEDTDPGDRTAWAIDRIDFRQEIWLSNGGTGPDQRESSPVQS